MSANHVINKRVNHMRNRLDTAFVIRAVEYHHKDIAVAFTGSTFDCFNQFIKHYIDAIHSVYFIDIGRIARQRTEIGPKFFDIRTRIFVDKSDGISIDFFSKHLITNDFVMQTITILGV